MTRVPDGFRKIERLSNSRGTCHGGVLATLADLALGPIVRASAIFARDGKRA